MANNINREGFKRFLELGAPSFEGNIILDSGELSEYYYRFMRIPLAYGEHKVDVLYGQRFYGTLENKPVTFNQEIRFLCLVVDNAKTVNETLDFKTIFCRSSFTSDSVIEEMAQKLFDMFRENVTEEDKKKILKGGYYDQTARQNAFCRIIKGYKNYRSPIDSIVDEIGKGSCFGLTMMAASILCLWTTVSESLSRHPMSSRTVTESFLPGARPARNCLTSMSRSHKIAEFAFSTANLCMTGSCLRAAPFFVPFSLHIFANRIDWYSWRCFHH